jgi:PIN domain nuclease of toxin-antitoxin system
MYLLDTHIIVWIAMAPQRLSAQVRTVLEEADAALHVSFASAWEYSAKRLKFPGQFTKSFAELLDGSDFVQLDCEFELHKYAETLPLLHNDPFDRILIATALAHELTLITADQSMHRYAVPTLW